MIAKLSGVIDLTLSSAIILTTSSGVGYLVGVTDSICVPSNKGENLELFIKTIVKEDDISLYGFKSYPELVWFESLIKVSGVGARIALATLNMLSLSDISIAITSKNFDLFKKVSGLGEKIAQRIVNELKNEPSKNQKILATLGMPELQGMQHHNTQIIHNTQEQDVVSALEKLGYSRSQAANCISKITFSNPNLNEQELLTKAIREISNIKNL